MRSVIALLLCATLASCLPSTLAQLQATGVRTAFAARPSYQAIYRDVLQFLNGCVSGGFLFATNSIQGNLYTDISQGEIVVRNNNMGDKSVMLHVEIRSTGATSEVVAMAAPVGLWKNYGAILERHVLKGSSACR